MTTQDIRDMLGNRYDPHTGTLGSYFDPLYVKLQGILYRSFESADNVSQAHAHKVFSSAKVKR